MLLARFVETPDGDVRLLGREMHWVPNDAYLLRNATEHIVASHGYIPALASAENDQSVPIWLHTHPGRKSSPRPSKRDEAVDKELAGLFQLRSGSPFYGSVVIARKGQQLSFAGHIESTSRRDDIDRLWVTGRRLTLSPNWLQKKPATF